MNKHLVKIVDPDEAITDALSALLATYGIDASIYRDGASFLRATLNTNTQIDCVMIEANLPDMSGLKALRELRNRSYRFPIVLFCDHSHRNLRDHALRFGATRVIDKSLTNDFLLEWLDSNTWKP